MNIREGARRIKFVGNTTLILSSFGLALTLILSLLERYSDLALSTRLWPLMPIILLLGCASIFATLLLLAGWIVEGFAQPYADSKAQHHPGD